MTSNDCINTVKNTVLCLGWHSLRLNNSTTILFKKQIFKVGGLNLKSRLVRLNNKLCLNSLILKSLFMSCWLFPWTFSFLTLIMIFSFHFSLLYVGENYIFMLENWLDWFSTYAWKCLLVAMIIWTRNVGSSPKGFIRPPNKLEKHHKRKKYVAITRIKKKNGT